MKVLLHTKEYDLSIKIQNVLKEKGIEVINFNDEIRLFDFIKYIDSDYIVFVDSNISQYCEDSINSNKLGVFPIKEDMSEDCILLAYKMQKSLIELKREYRVRDINSAYQKEINNNNLFKPLVSIKQSIKDCIDKHNSLFLFGETGTGKSFISELVAREYENYMIIDAKNEDNIEELLFGSITPQGTKSGLLDDCSVIVIENIYCIPIRIINKIATYIVYRQYSKINSSNMNTSNCSFIFIPNTDKRNLRDASVLLKYVYNSITLDTVSKYKEKDRESVLLQMYKWGDILINKDVRYFLNKYNYKFNLYELQEIAHTIRKTIKDDMQVRPEDLPFWITNNKAQDTTYYNNGLREIVDKEIYNLRDVESIAVKSALKKTHWKKEEAAKLLGVSMGTLRKKISTYNISIENLMEV